jgi:hypothetical protein
MRQGRAEAGAAFSCPTIVMCGTTRADTRASRVITSTIVASSTFSSRNKPRRRKTMSKQDEQDWGAAVTFVCALLLSFLFVCCAVKTMFDKLHSPAVETSEEVTKTEETE